MSGAHIITSQYVEGSWDLPVCLCVGATLANKSSVVDVTQILAVLRMPYTRKHSVELLNLSAFSMSSSWPQSTLNQAVG